MDMMDNILSQGADARKLSLALQHVAYSGELTQQMMNHSQAMEKIYNELQQLVAAKTDDQKPFSKLIKKVEKNTEWFEKAKAGNFETRMHSECS